MAHPKPGTAPRRAVGRRRCCLEPLGVALQAWDIVHGHVGQTVGVVGCGPIGNLVVQIARAAGATRVIALEPLSHRREAALAAGADAAHAPSGVADMVDLVSSCDVVVEVAGTDSGVLGALQRARPGAKVALVGIPADDRTSFPAALARRKGLSLHLVRRMNGTYPRAIRLVTSGQVNLRSLVTGRYALIDVEEAFRAAAERRGLKTMVTPA